MVGHQDALVAPLSFSLPGQRELQHWGPCLVAHPAFLPFFSANTLTHSLRQCVSGIHSLSSSFCAFLSCPSAYPVPVSASPHFPGSPLCSPNPSPGSADPPLCLCGLFLFLVFIFLFPWFLSSFLLCCLLLFPPRLNLSSTFQLCFPSLLLFIPFSFSSCPLLLLSIYP